jgi:hypothetical protein
MGFGRPEGSLLVFSRNAGSLLLDMLEDLKILANRRDAPDQSLLKVFLAERLARERQTRVE